jgi:hypothetical protein
MRRKSLKFRRQDLRSPNLARGFSPPSTASLFCDIFDNLNLGELIHLPQVGAAQELQIKAQTRPASLMEEKFSNANFCSIHLARRRQNNRTTSRPHFD